MINRSSQRGHCSLFCAGKRIISYTERLARSKQATKKLFLKKKKKKKIEVYSLRGLKIRNYLYCALPKKGEMYIMTYTVSLFLEGLP